MRSPALAVALIAVAACTPSKPANKPDTTTPAAATQAGAPNDSARVATMRAEITAAEKAWGDAAVKKDSAGMSSLMADEYVSLGPNGDSMPKQAVLREMVAQKDTLLGSRAEAMRIQPLGDSNAIVCGVGVWTMRGKNGKPQDMRASFTEVFTRRAGRWQAVVGHYTPLPNATAAKKP